jgi:hypothetical protein
MKLKETQLNCQIPCLQDIAEDFAEVPSESIGRRAKLMVRRRLRPGKERALKNYTNDRMNRFCQLTGRSVKPAALLTKNNSDNLQKGDWVKVRSLSEIIATLNHWKQVKGCAFMSEMAEYCGSTHRVLKNMKRFLDERDYLIKKSSGIILLEGVICQGTAEFGRCDRACFHFWRDEWLEKVEEPLYPQPDVSAKRLQAGDWVRVRALKEIEKTLDHRKQLKGCAFMPEMGKYCGTKQLVLKSMKRFVDERDLRVKKSSGIILLEETTCQGVAEFGNCDRSCFYLWREEWLEKVDYQSD